MATFTQDEIGLLESKGNDYCRKVWQGLFEGTPPSDSRDEQAIKEFMIEKYEKKRYYLEPSQNVRNGHSQSNGVDKTEPKTGSKMSSSEPKPILNNKYNSSNFQTSNRRRPEVPSNFIQPQMNHLNGGDFVANFDTADIFSASNNNGSATQQQGFANFDNNPVFSNNSTTHNGLPTTTLLNQNNQKNQLLNNCSNTVPSEDKYAALKDLDNALKSQSALDWSSSGSNGSLYSSPTPTGSMYSSPSPQSSLFGSPSQSQFLNGFGAHQEANGLISNPFGNNGFSWNNGKTNGLNNGLNGGLNGSNGFNMHNNYQNPFRVSELNKLNGFTQMVQPQMNGDMAWTPNPFKVGATTMSSNNPFL
ncbi:hypothetical protein HHI36_003779 [Cryptolaemus montrouzieri]